MGVWEAIARMRRQFLCLTAGLCLSILLFTAWGTLAPIDVTVIPIEPDLWLIHAWPGATDSLLWFLGCMAGLPIGAATWALVVQRRRPWPFLRGEPRIVSRVALRVVPLLFMVPWQLAYRAVFDAGVYTVVPDQAWLDLSGTALQSAIDSILIVGGSWALGVLGIAVVAEMLRQWDPGRPVAWLEPRTPGVTEVEAVSA